MLTLPIPLCIFAQIKAVVTRNRHVIDLALKGVGRGQKGRGAQCACKIHINFSVSLKTQILRTTRCHYTLGFYFKGSFQLIMTSERHM